MPGHPETVAVARARGFAHTGIVIYDNGVSREDRTPNSASDSRVMIAFGDRIVAQRRVRIPMRAGVSSLNLATSVAAVLFAWRLSARAGARADG